MKYSVSWLPSAAKDLKEIRDFLDIEAPEQAKGIVTAIYDAAMELDFMPTRWKHDDEKPEYRRFVVRNKYKIFFQITGDRVIIHHIRHTARNNEDL